jgi:CHAT domain-containing protein
VRDWWSNHGVLWRWWRDGRKLTAWTGLLLGLLSVCGLTGCHATDPDPSAVFQSISNDFLHGDLDLAQQKAEQARKDFSSGKLAREPTWGLRFRLLEAEILLRQYHPKDALALLTQAGTPVPTEGDLAIKRDVLCALAHSRLDQSALAAEELREARRLTEATHSSLVGEVLRAEALMARDTDHPEQALQKFKASLAAAREHGNLLLQAVDLVDIGFDSLQSGHYAEALVLFQEAVDFTTSVHAQRQLLISVGNMGWAYQNLGDFEHALDNFQQAEQLAQQIHTTRNRVLWLQDAGLAEYRLGNLEAARKYDEEALRAAATLPAADEVDQVVNIETNLALLLFEQAQYPAAKTYSDAAALAARGSKDNTVVAYAGFVAGLLATRLADPADAERRLLAAQQLTSDPDIHTEVDNTVANLYAGRQQPEQAEVWYRRSIQAFEDKRAAIKDEALRLAAFGYGAAVYRDYAGFLIAAHRETEALQLLDRSRARTLEEGLGAAAEARPHEQQVTDARAVARKLDATLLFYSLGREKSYLWAITPRETQLFALPGARQLESWVEAHQKAVQKSADLLKSAQPAGMSLYNTLIAPAAPLIATGSRVFVIPDGALHALNFETLLEPTADGVQYWIEHVTVTTASSIGMLARWQPKPAAAAARELLLIGNPLPSRGEFAALQNAAAEIKDIRQHFAPQSQSVLTQAQAVPTAYATSAPDQFQYIHFVAHGTASRLSPLDSAVVLSPPPNNPQEFKLYARDIVQHRLNANLVTISTCYGSGVRTYAGEGLVGLAWVFLRAGSHNVIGALWQADDASTPLLMDRLYSELRAGKTPDVALRDAKLMLLHSPNVYRKPFYWGAFQLYAGS